MGREGKLPYLNAHFRIVTHRQKTQQCMDSIKYSKARLKVKGLHLPKHACKRRFGIHVSAKTGANREFKIHTRSGVDNECVCDRR
jgi:hypothetical protein